MQIGPLVSFRCWAQKNKKKFGKYQDLEWNKINRNGYIFLITKFNPEDGDGTSSETLVSNHQTTWYNNPQKPQLQSLSFFTTNC
jgi:hypothetical protein